MWHPLISYAPLAGFLATAAAIDWRSRRIPNWLTLTTLVGGLVQSLLAHGTVHPAQAVTGLLAGFALSVVLFVLGGLGAGDVKLLAGVGAWLGPIGIVQVFLIEAVIGLLIVLAQCAAERKLLALVRNSALITINLLHVRELGLEHVSRTGQGCRSVGRPLPYAVPVLLATGVVVLWRMGGWG